MTVQRRYTMSIWGDDFLQEHGYIKGSKEEATHYSTYGTVEELIKLIDGVPHYWNGRYWCESGLTVDQITPLGQQEPNFRCGARQPAPPKPDFWMYSGISNKHISKHYRGD